MDGCGTCAIRSIEIDINGDRSVRVRANSLFSMSNLEEENVDFVRNPAASRVSSSIGQWNCDPFLSF